MKRAVVLSGGGARGAYHIGVWQALRELGITYDIVTGTSIGSLNGVLMAQDDLGKAVHLWENISTEQVVVLPESPPNATAEERFRLLWKEIFLHNGADAAPLEKLIHDAIDLTALRQSPILLGIVTVEYPSMTPLEVDIRTVADADLASYLMASSACRPAFKLREIHGKKYIDGCYYDNLPINLAINLGALEIIAVDLHAVGLKQPPQTELPTILIDCYWDLGDTLYFDGEWAKRNMQLGCNDTYKAFSIHYGYCYTFTASDTGRWLRRYRQLMLLFYAMLICTDAPAAKDFRDALQARLEQFAARRGAHPALIDKRLELVWLFAESCGELYNLTETRLYTPAEFERAILQQALSTLQQMQRSEQDLFAHRVDRSLRRSMHYYYQLSALVRSPHALSACRLNKRLLTEWPDELLAAVYLTLLMP